MLLQIFCLLAHEVTLEGVTENTKFKPQRDILQAFT